MSCVLDNNIFMQLNPCGFEDSVANIDLEKNPQSFVFSGRLEKFYIFKSLCLVFFFFVFNKKEK